MSKFSILLLGYSSIAKKAIMPALKNHSQIYLKAIASKSKYSLIPKSYSAYNSYKKAIDESECNIVYISLHNSAHFPWILYALKRKKHVICDKPIFLNSKEAQKCIRQAAGKFLIYESIPYIYHKQHQTLKEIIKKLPNQPSKITIHFGFPSFESKNYRNSAKLGGGCINDIGSYLISAGLYYFGSFPKKIQTIANYRNKVPVNASVSMNFEKGRVLLAHIGFDLEYQNNFEIWGKNSYFKISRAFSTPADFNASINYKISDKEGVKKIGLDDCFKNMFDNFAKLLKQKDFSGHNQLNLKQAKILEAMNKA